MGNFQYMWGKFPTNKYRTKNSKLQNISEIDDISIHLMSYIRNLGKISRHFVILVHPRNYDIILIQKVLRVAL